MFFVDAMEKWGEYTGSSIAPNNFFDFWDNGKKMVENLGCDFQIKTVPFKSNIVDAYELTFEGINKGRIYCQLVCPKNNEQRLPVVLQFHGYHYSSGDWTDKVSLASEGAVVISMDVRGQGGPSIDTTVTKGATDVGHILLGMDEGPENLFYRAVFLDTYQLSLISSTLPNVDPDRVYVYGGSQGGALALACAGLNKKIKKTFVQYPFLSDYKGMYSQGVENTAYGEIADWFKTQDPLHQREKDLFDTINYIDIQHFAPAIQSEIVWGMGLKDTLCPPKSQFAVYNKLQCDKEILAYPDLGHEYLPRYNDYIRKKIFS